MAALGYVGVQIVFGSERRLLSIEKDLEVARPLKFSIGDFYEFIGTDGKQIGFLVAGMTPGPPPDFQIQPSRPQTRSDEEFVPLYRLDPVPTTTSRRRG